MSFLNCSVVYSCIVEGISTEPSECRSRRPKAPCVLEDKREVLKRVSLYCTEVFDFTAILAIFLLFKKSKEYY